MKNWLRKKLYGFATSLLPPFSMDRVLEIAQEMGCNRELCQSITRGEYSTSFEISCRVDNITNTVRIQEPFSEGQLRDKIKDLNEWFWSAKTR